MANTIKARYDAGVTNFSQDGTAVAIPLGIIDPHGRSNKEVTLSDTDPTLRAQTHGNEPEVVIPVLTPDRAEKRQNGRRFKEDGDPSFTLTAQDIHGVAIEIKEATKQGYAEARVGDSINLAMPESTTRRGRIGHGCAQTLDTSCEQGVLEVIDGPAPEDEHPGMYVRLAEDLVVWAVWYEKYQCYIAIRKLTPRECFRLQGWSDEYFDRAQFVNSDSQLYKQAGNGVTVNVVQLIGEAIKEYENEKNTL